MFQVFVAFGVFATLCVPNAAEEGCLLSPVVVEAELWSDGPAGPGEVRWLLDGAVVASDRLETLAPEPQKVALILEPAKTQHRVGVEVRGTGSASREEAWLPPVCPSVLQLAAFLWGREGLLVRLANLGPWRSGRIPVRWTINGVRYSEQALDPLPAQASAELSLPASVSPLLLQALAEGASGGRKSRRRIPVMVVLEARPGPVDLESPKKSWPFFLGFSQGQGRP